MRIIPVSTGSHCLGYSSKKDKGNFIQNGMAQLYHSHFKEGIPGPGLYAEVQNRCTSGSGKCTFVQKKKKKKKKERKRQSNL